LALALPVSISLSSDEASESPPLALASQSPPLLQVSALPVFAFDELSTSTLLSPPLPPSPP
jgi:hypothetical protein